IWFHWIIGLLLIPAAFALAWLGHLIEGNKPAFLNNPMHVFVAPVWMARKILGMTDKKSAQQPKHKIFFRREQRSLSYHPVGRSRAIESAKTQVACGPQRCFASGSIGNFSAF